MLAYSYHSKQCKLPSAGSFPWPEGILASSNRDNTVQPAFQDTLALAAILKYKQVHVVSYFNPLHTKFAAICKSAELQTIASLTRRPTGLEYRSKRREGTNSRRKLEYAVLTCGPPRA